MTSLPTFNAQLLVIIASACTLAAAACQTEVTAAGLGGDGGTGPAGGATAAGGISAIAEPVLQNPDPADLSISIGNYGTACAVGFVSKGCPAESIWEIAFLLHGAFQTPGTYQVADLGSLITFLETLPNGDGTCGSAGGATADGELQVVAIDSASITITLSGLTLPSPTPLDGTYTVAICP